MSKKWLIVAAVVVLIAALGYVGYPYLLPQQATAEEPAETAIVRRGTLLVTVEGSGSLAPHSEVSLSFSAGGRVHEVLVVEGQQVEAGQPLARLDTDDLALQLAQAEANLAQIQAGARAEDITAAEASLRNAQANYDMVAAGARPEDIAAAEATLRNVQANYDKLAAGPRAEEVTIAQADLARAEAAVRRAQADYDKVAGRADIAAMPQALALEEATQNREKALATYKLQVSGPTPQELVAAQAQVDQAQAQLDKLWNSPTPQELAAAQAQVDQTQAQLDQLVNGPTRQELAGAQVQVDQARLRLEQASLTASVAGTVTALNVQPGEWVGMGQAIIVLSNLTALEVDVNLDETDVVRVAVGQEAQVSLDAFPGVEMAGEVTYIASTAQTRTGVVLYPVTIRLTPGDLPLRAGMTADVEITTASQEDVLIVPLRAVEVEGEHAYVQRLAGDQTERVAVELGMVTETEVEIMSDVAEDDVVIVVPSAQGSTGGGMFGMFGGGE